MSWLILTGGAGYVGSLLVKRLVDKYEYIVVLDPCLYGTNGVEKHKNVIFHKKGFDTLEPFTALQGGKCAGIIHLGGLSNDPMVDDNIESNMIINVDLTKKLVDWAIKNEIPKFIFASSASVYGFDDRGLEIKEDDKLNPQSAYARSKIECEDYLKINDEELAYVIVRKGTLMGVSERMRFDLVVNTMCYYAFTKGSIGLYSGGECWRPLVDVEDAAEFYDWLFHYKDWTDIENEVFNLVHKNYRISELGLYVRHIIKNHPMFPRDIEIVPDYDKQEQRSYRISGEKIRKLGFEPRNGLYNVVDKIWTGLNMGEWDLTDPIYWSVKWLGYCKRMCENMGTKYEPLFRA